MGAHDPEGVHRGGSGGCGLTWPASFSVEALLGGAGIALAVGPLGAYAVARIRARGVRVAYTRKIFHFVIFTIAALVHLVWDLAGTISYGTLIAALVLGTVFVGDGHPFYEALAREKDRPKRSLFIVVPLVTTAVGGLLSALVAGPFASVGYLAAGWGDAAGEPVGARWGRHPYRVPSLAGVPATRTVEGSVAVFIVASAGSAVALFSLGWGVESLWVAALCGLGSALVEAVSNHGLDNLTVQLAGSVIAWILLA